MAARLLVLAALLCAGSALLAQAQPTSSSKAGAFIIFGDSISDTGNYFNTPGLGNRTFPVPNVTINGTRQPVYWRGRFTNAQGNWADRLARNVRRIAVSSFAFAGATLCPPSFYAGASALSRRIPSVINQTSLFFRKLQNDSKYNATISSREPIPVILAGANDITIATPILSPANAPAFVQNLTQCMVASARALLDRGIKTIVIANLVPVDLTPIVVSNNLGSALAPLVGALNTQFASAVGSLQRGYPNATVILWDVNKDFGTGIRNSTSLGFKFNNTNQCVRFAPGGTSLFSIPTSVCRNPNEYVFFDNQHPSFRAHGLVTQSFINVMINASVGMTRADLVRPGGVGRRLIAADLD